MSLLCKNLGYACYGAVSPQAPFSHYMLSYQGEGMVEAKLHNVDEDTLSYGRDRGRGGRRRRRYLLCSAIGGLL
ncbi:MULTISPECIES: hypothetical protein [unclassified Bartonella]|uniref:hypothetical protein n=1 Tax=Bartonella TaxID=773 RepID=UPI0035CF112D